MLRGVNKKIIEVVDTQSDYFERAILFVKDRKLDENESEIKRNADEFMKSAGSLKLRRILYHIPIMEVIKLLSAACVGAAIVLILTLL
ncbi:hypothetical protein EDD70_0914 [Hydrogenoanaerobacterium saccharovorans]|uniref:Uncharacterized protein n=1 Tax=Hydrogenoanaerobacterium saccharovorans TaxID=474960 RepID=A0A1H8A839_9FIRM|nr:hypothetical protein [Hydrogenoanaerobacterium saccharovorans]RPF48102.1 hypothetical protein EDD70_0914 [Hydrogenoanaerobacterium saccharovorans]SEM66761.1 hypothetical protein SAMN05216180_1177 [Hydrogenoanaerobacterium saccharovorans]